MNKITVYFNTCTPAPSGGYNIKYRVQGSVAPYTNAGNFFISPAVFYDNINPEGTCYEGYIQTICSDVLGTAVMWESCGSGGSGCESGIGIIIWNYINNVGLGGRFKILLNGVLIVNTTITESGSFNVIPGNTIDVIVQTILGGTATIQIIGDYNNNTTSDHINADYFTVDGCIYTINGSSD